MASCHSIDTVPQNVKKNIRHAEKRRTATCVFADRVAQVSIAHYRQLVPPSERPTQTCLATIVSHDRNGNLKVVGMGVGTKFLSESVLYEEGRSHEYGRRLRDCHAEVLARRAFRRQLTLEMMTISSSPEIEFPTSDRILQQSTIVGSTAIQYRLRSGITLHMYSSSSPCGNATLKKFSKMTKEHFRDDLGPDEWPKEPHEPIHGSSIQLGQFSLLLKKDGDAATTTCRNAGQTFDSKKSPTVKGKMWPAMMSDDWAPPGTTIVGMTHKGSIHTCSDKISRWNYLGLQGSLLSSLLEEPLYLSTMTVGRKFTSCICRRAICCRMEEWQGAKKPRQLRDNEQSTTEELLWNVRQNHPAILGTAVYMDETGVVETSADLLGQDVRFHSSKSWCWWPLLEQEEVVGYVERIDGSSGYLWNEDGLFDAKDKPSRVSTMSLSDLFLEIHRLASDHGDLPTTLNNDIFTLADLLNLKRKVSPHYESSKQELLSKHRIFRQWRRRTYSSDHSGITS